MTQSNQENIIKIEPDQIITDNLEYWENHRNNLAKFDQEWEKIARDNDLDDLKQPYQATKEDLELPISQKLNDYISVYRLLMYVKSTCYMDGLTLLSKNEYYTMPPDLDIEKDHINTSILMDIHKIQYMAIQVSDILKNNPSIKVYERERGIAQRIVITDTFKRVFNGLKLLYFDYLDYVEANYPDEYDEGKSYIDLVINQVANNKNIEDIILEGVPPEKQNKIFYKYINIRCFLDGLKYQYITREIAETVFNYPKEYRPDGYNEQKELETNTHQLKAELEALKNDYNKVVAELEKAKKELNSRKHNNSTIEARDQVIAGLCYMVQRETNLKKTWNRLNIQKGKITKTSLAGVLADDILKHKLDISNPREQETIKPILIDTKDL